MKLVPSSAHTLNPAAAMVVGEVVSNVATMLTEMSQYKRAMAQLMVQREQMHEQAKVAQLQIKAQYHTEIKKINSLSKAFKQTLAQNELLIQMHAQSEQNIQQLCLQILQMMSTADAEKTQALQMMWSNLITQTEVNRQESVRLHKQLMDANQQFGISISHRDLSWHDVR